MKKSILLAATATAAAVTLVGIPATLDAQNAQPGPNAAAGQVSRKKVFQVHVILDQTLSVQGGKGSATMILFHGDLDTTFFKGEIQPGAVDTQKSGSISARYIIQGQDAEGTPTKIFIENNQVNGVLKPMVLTDNPKLRWLETTDWEARIAMGGFGGFGGGMGGFGGGMGGFGGGMGGFGGGMPPMGGGFGGGFPGFGGGAPGGAAPGGAAPGGAAPAGGNGPAAGGMPAMGGFGGFGGFGGGAPAGAAPGGGNGPAAGGMPAMSGFGGFPGFGGGAPAGGAVAPAGGNGPAAGGAPAGGNRPGRGGNRGNANGIAGSGAQPINIPPANGATPAAGAAPAGGNRPAGGMGGGGMSINIEFYAPEDDATAMANVQK